MDIYVNDPESLISSHDLYLPCINTTPSTGFFDLPV